MRAILYILITLKIFSFMNWGVCIFQWIAIDYVYAQRLFSTGYAGICNAQTILSDYFVVLVSFYFDFFFHFFYYFEPISSVLNKQMERRKRKTHQN